MQIPKELDFRIEASNLSTVRASEAEWALRDLPADSPLRLACHVPEPLSPDPAREIPVATERALCMEFIPGPSIRDTKWLDEHQVS